jgi:phosphonoacetaldehyde methylase
MKILCFNPPVGVPEYFGKPWVHVPLGLAYVAASLQKNNDVTFLDANAEGFEKAEKVGNYYRSGLSKEEIIDRIAKINPEVICMSIMFTVNSTNALDVLGEIKKNFPKVITVVGGHHVSVRPEETLRNSAVDFIVFGEGRRPRWSCSTAYRRTETSAM